MRAVPEDHDRADAGRKVLVVDVGGTNVKLLASGQTQPRKFPSGRKLTPELMVAAVKKAAKSWEYDVVSIGYPGLLLGGQIASEPHNLAPGWVGYDFEAAFGCPVKVLNDAAMQALGSYTNGSMLFLGLGTGLGSAMVVDGTVVPMELAHLSYRDGTYEDYVGERGLKRYGRKKWERHVARGVARLVNALHPEDVVLGGGNAKRVKSPPEGCRIGDNDNAFAGGFRMWADGQASPREAARAKGAHA